MFEKGRKLQTRSGTFEISDVNYGDGLVSYVLKDINNPRKTIDITLPQLKFLFPEITIVPPKFGEVIIYSQQKDFFQLAVSTGEAIEDRFIKTFAYKAQGKWEYNFISDFKTFNQDQI